MSKYSHTVEYNLRTTLDKTGLAQLQTQIRQVQQQLHVIQNEELISKKSATQALKTIGEVQTALNSAFNPKLGMLDNKKLISNINNIKGGLNGIYQAFAMSGTQGVQAFSQFYGQLTTVDRGLKQVSSTTDKIFNTLGNTVRWGLIASGFASVMTAARESVQYVKDLDESLTNIMMVTGYSKDQMNEYAKSANEAAKALRSTTVAMTDATLVFAQQGYDVQTSQKLASSSVKLANVSQQDTATASDEITAYMNAFKIPLKDIDNALSKWAKVANVSAADVEELSVASQKAASTANTVGVNMDQLAAQIAAIETVTREAPENIGNGLKTLYARFSDIRMGETLEDGVDLGKVTTTLEKVGVQVVNAEGNMRQVGDIMEDLMSVWGDLDLTQRSSIATTLAGKFQLSRFTALMNRSDLYQEYLGASENETGTETLDMMQEVFENSLQGRLNKLQSTIENIFTNAFNTDDFYNMIDAVTQLVQVFADLTDAIGGGSNAMTAFAAIATRTFSAQIGQGIGNFIYNRQQAKQYKNSQIAAQDFAKEQVAGRGLNIGDARVQSAVDDIASVEQYRSGMNEETAKTVNVMQKERLNGLEKELALEQEINTQRRLVSLVHEGELKTDQEILNALQQRELSGWKYLGVEELVEAELNELNTKLTVQAEQAAKVVGVIQRQSRFGDMMRLDGKVGQTGATVREWIQAFQSMKKEARLTENELKRLTAADKIFDETLDQNVFSAKDLIMAFQQYSTVLTEVAEGIQLVGADTKITTSSYGALMSELQAQQGFNQQSHQGLKGKKEELEVQDVSSSVSTLASAAMTGMFAIQSFGAILDTVGDKELTFAQKAEQIAMNLTMVAAMGIPAITQTIDSVKNLYKNIRTWTVATLELEIAEDAVTAAQTRQAIATKLVQSAYGKKLLGVLALITGNKNLVASEVAATIASRGLTAAIAPLAAMAVPLVAVAAAIGIAVYKINQHSEKLERQKQAMEDLISTSNETVAKIKENKESLDALYKSSKETGEVSDELKNALLEQAEALGIVDAQIYASLGEYDELKKKIDETTRAQLGYNTALLQRQREEDFSSTDFQGKTLKALYGDNEATQYISSMNDALSNPVISGIASAFGGSGVRIAINEFRDSMDTVVNEDVTKKSIFNTNAAYKQQVRIIEELQLEYAKCIAEAEKLTNNTNEQEAKLKEAEKIQEDITKEVERQAELSKIINDEGIQQNLEKYNQIVSNQEISALTSGSALSSMNIGNLDLLKEQLTDVNKTVIGKEFAEDFALQMQEAGLVGADALVLSFAQKMIDAGVQNQFDETALRLEEQLISSATTFAKKQGGDQETQDRNYSYMKEFLENNIEASPEAKIKLIAQLDMEQSRNKIQKDIENLNEEDIFKAELLVSTDDAQERISDVLEAFKKDEVVGSEQLKDLYSQEIVEIFEKASNGSKAFADAMTLLADGSFNTQNNLIALNGALDDIEHAIALDNLSESAEELSQRIDEASYEGQEFLDLLNDMDSFEDNAFSLSLDFGGDLIDQADAMIEAIGDIGDATGKIGEGFLIAAEDAKVLENAFPGILENYQVTADGMIQLDQEIAQSAMGAATSDLESSSYAQAAKLNNYADYAQTVSEMYMQEAVAMAEKAEKEIATEEEANEFIKKKDYELGEYQEDLMNQRNLASMVAAQNEIQYSEDAGMGIANSFNQGVLFAQGALQALSNAAKTAAANIIGFFAGPVANAISLGVTGKSVSEILTDAWVEQGVPSGGQIVGAEIRPGQEININGKNYTVNNSEGSVIFAKKAMEYQTQALSLRRAAGQARAAAAAVQAKGLEGKDNINSAGQPKETKEKEEKPTKEKAPKEEKEEEEQIQRQARQDAGNAELDIYKKIDTWIDKLKNNYSKLNKIRNITWSKDRLKLMNLELGNLKSQQKALQDRLKISKDYQQVLKNGTEVQKRMYGIETTLAELGLTDNNSNGVIDNYKEQWQVANKEAKKWEDAAEDYFKTHGGKVDKYGNALQDSLMFEEDRQTYQNLVDTAKNYYNIVQKIEDVTQKYEDTWKEIQETEEQALDLMLQMQDIQIEAYTKSLESLDTLQEMRDIMADMIGMWSGFELDSPFRGLVEDVQQVKDLFEDSEYNAAAYYDNIIKTLERKKAQASKELQANYDAAIKFYKAEKDYAKNNKDGLGTGELAQASRKLSEMQRWMDNPNVVDNPYAVYDEANKKWIVNTQQLLEDFTEQYKKVTSLALEAEKAWEEAQKNIIDALDEEAEKLDKLYNKYDDVIKDLERASDEVKLLYGEESYEKLMKLADESGKVAIEKGKKYQKEYNYWEKQQEEIKVQDAKERQRRIKEAEEILRKASTKEEIANGKLLLEQAKNYVSEEWEWYDERMRETYQKMRDEQERAAKAFKEVFDLQIKDAEAAWLESALGTRNAKYALDAWNRDVDYWSKYKDDVQREYEVEKLRYKWQKMLNDANDASLKVQKKIKQEGQEIVDQLANQTTMSEYDVKLANAKLEILQKQIALEEAQKNKNQMKLQRDTQGNYKYVYAQDLDDIAEKRDELLQSIYDVYNISKQKYIDSTTEYLNAVVEAGEKAAEIWSDTSLTIEERQKLIDELVADTGRLLETTAEDVQDGFTGMTLALEWGTEAGTENIARMSEDVLQILKSNNAEAIQAIGVPWDQEFQSKLQNIGAVKVAFVDMTTTMGSSARDFISNLTDQINGVASITGRAYGSVEDAINKSRDATKDLYNETLKLYTLFGLESDALKEAQKTLEKYRDALDAATKGSGNFADKIRAANQSIIKQAKESGNWITEAAAPVKIEEGKANPYAIDTSAVTNVVVSSKNYKAAEIGDVSVASTPEVRGYTSAELEPAATYTPAKNNGNISAAKTNTNKNEKGLYRATSSSGTVIGYWTDQSRAATEVLNYGNGLGSVDLVPMVYKTGYTLEGAAGKRTQRDNPWSTYKMRHFATGGYTGSWSDNGIDEKGGKLAVLHQKELVLNATDTKNILAAVDLVRQMTEGLKVASLNTTFNNYGKAQTQTVTDTIEQRVEIAAEFPNANSANEIKEALLNLSDSAMTYSYRER